MTSREVIQVVEIVQPFCGNVYGVSPCTATAGVGEAYAVDGAQPTLVVDFANGVFGDGATSSTGNKCYNTFSTCQDTANFNASTLSLFFCKDDVASNGLAAIGGPAYAIPSLVSVSTAPTKINLAASDRNASGLGNLAVCNVQIKDHPHTDRVVDPYIKDRSWDGLERGTYWTKWKTRNKYRQNIIVKVHEGYADQSWDDFVTRTYEWQEISGPSSGRVMIKAKSPLARLEARKAQAPIASPGVLFADISDSATSFEASEAVEADYTATGTIRIGTEVMTYTGRATSTNGVTFTGVTRATDGTVADTHAEGDSVQQCLRYTEARMDDILEDLLTNYANVPASYQDTTAWATEIDNYAPSILLSTLITAPTAVTQLVSEIQEQGAILLWWDERTATIKLRVLTGVDAIPDLLTEETNIIDGSLSMSEMPASRVSQVWVFYGQVNPTEALDDETNWNISISADLASEGANQYGEKSVRKVFGRWLPSGALSTALANKILNRYVDVPRSVSFRLAAKDRDYWTGDTVRLSTDLDLDDYGVRTLSNWTIVSAEEIAPGEEIEYVAHDTTLYGRIYKILEAGAADYDPATAEYSGFYIGDADGLLPDGTPCARIS